MTISSLVLSILFIGIGATLVMDLWTVLLRYLGVTTLNYAMVGRWAGHLLEGRWQHAAIGKAAPVRGELALGWLLHYATGLVFAALLAAIAGEGWLRVPTLCQPCCLESSRCLYRCVWCSLRWGQGILPPVPRRRSGAACVAWPRMACSVLACS